MRRPYKRVKGDPENHRHLKPQKNTQDVKKINIPALHLKHLRYDPVNIPVSDVRVNTSRAARSEDQHVLNRPIGSNRQRWAFKTHNKGVLMGERKKWEDERSAIQCCR